MEKVFYRKPTDDLKDLDEHSSLGFFCLSHFELQFTLDKIFRKNLRPIKNQPLKSVEQLFRIISDN